MNVTSVTRLPECHFLGAPGNRSFSAEVARLLLTVGHLYSPATAPVSSIGDAFSTECDPVHIRKGTAPALRRATHRGAQAFIQAEREGGRSRPSRKQSTAATQ